MLMFLLIDFVYNLYDKFSPIFLKFKIMYNIREENILKKNVRLKNLKNYHITSVLIVVKSLTIIFLLYDCIRHFDFEIKCI